QKAMIFNDTVRANVTCYDESITDDRIRRALDLACFSEVVETMPEGMNTVMAQNGMNVSGGQRQRLSLARTFAKDAAIYVFDDSLSALDAQTERKVREAIHTELAGKTVLIVSQKISNVRDADKIIVLEKGRVAGEGTHDELLKSCHEYQEIYKIQCYTEKEG
ncbi:MAG: ABC transporter ATP-binding protein, partial [Clostridia bacterium]|nr:ABC transporter ATP-binding protein [Clostridia bacterium]